jgi:hypothetical protein
VNIKDVIASAGSGAPIAQRQDNGDSRNTVAFGLPLNERISQETSMKILNGVTL